MTLNSNKEREWLLSEKYSGKECPEFFKDLRRVESGEPLAYVIGHADFLGCRIDLSLRPLIPRAETEWWVESVIKKQKLVLNERTRILDVFSGSGCIGIAFAKEFPHTSVDCADNDPKALEQIRINAEANRVGDRVSAIRSDVFEYIPERYDLILANPPYIDTKHPETVEGAVLDWEPHNALFAKEDGLFYLRKLIAGANLHLTPRGVLYAEFGKGQEQAISRLLDEYRWSYTIQNDQYGIPRWFEAKPC